MSSGTHIAFLVGASVGLIALAASVFVKEVPLRGAGPVTQQAEAV